MFIKKILYRKNVGNKIILLNFFEDNFITNSLLAVPIE